MRVWGAIAIALALLTGGSPAALAKPKSTTQYKYYPVSGDSAVDLYIAMMKRGPHVNGDQAYASTTATQTLDQLVAAGELFQQVQLNHRAAPGQATWILRLRPAPGKQATAAPAGQ